MTNTGPGALRLALVVAIWLGLPSISMAGPDRPPPSRAELLGLLDREDFAALDAVLQRLQDEVERDERPDLDVERAFDVFATSDPRVSRLLTGWRRHSADGFAVHHALGVHGLHRAWLLRGAASANATTRAQWQAMLTEAGQALEHIGAALQRRPQLSDAYARSIVVLNALGASGQAFALIDEGLAQLPHSVLIRQAQLTVLEPKWGGSIDAVAGALALVPAELRRRPDFAWLDGVLDRIEAEEAARRGDIDQALAGIRKARARGYVDWRYEAQLLAQAGRRGEALLAYGRRLEDNPDDIWTHLDLAALLAGTPAHATVQYHLDQALLLDPLRPEALAARGRLHAGLDRPDLATLDYANALILGRDDPDVALAAGGHLIRQEQQRWRGLEAIDHAIALRPHDPEILYSADRALEGARDCSLLPRRNELFERYRSLCEDTGSCASFDQARFAWRTSLDSAAYQCQLAGTATGAGR